MQWSKDHLETYVDTKEYIDTLLVPLVNINMKNDKQLIKSGLEREYIEILAYEIERRLAGRIMLLPTFVYTYNSHYDKEQERLNLWVQSFKQESFDNTFILTLDYEWSKRAQDIDGHILWLSHIPFDHINEASAKPFVKSQADNLSETIQSFWS